MTPWWQNAVVYALFPLSYKDSDGDGFGDIGGIIERLDHLSWLGVDAVWLGPVFASPMLDAGYDIADFCAIDPRFGTMAQFDGMLAEMHRRGMKAILDFVPNHTSDQHPWFKESRASRHNPKRDWYIWRDGRQDGKPPTNWIDNTDQCAWEWDEQTGQFYYHLFLPGQPDLNFRNPEVTEAMQDVLAFWLERGVDGFRLDAAMNLVEDAFLRDEPMSDDIASGPPGWMDHLFTSDRPESHSVLAAFREVIDSYPEKLFVGEVIAPVDRAMRFYGQEEPELHLPFNNQIMKTEPWDARRIDAAIDQYMVLLPEGASPNWVIGSHDVSRLASRVGQDQARVAAMLLLSLPGTAFLFYGDEIGMEDAKVGKHEVRDPYDKYGSGRDPYRAPMPWTDGENAGFSAGKPWLPLPPKWKQRNVAALMADERSILHLHRALIALRKERAALQTARYEPRRGDEAVLAFVRPHPEGDLLVALNFGDKPQVTPLDRPGRLLLSTLLDRMGPVGEAATLRPNEGIIVALDDAP